MSVTTTETKVGTRAESDPAAVERMNAAMARELGGGGVANFNFGDPLLPGEFTPDMPVEYTYGEGEPSVVKTGEGERPVRLHPALSGVQFSLDLRD
jgi:hypothetical protein